MLLEAVMKVNNGDITVTDCLFSLSVTFHCTWKHTTGYTNS